MPQIIKNKDAQRNKTKKRVTKTCDPFNLFGN